MYCSSCGVEASSGLKYCSRCGSDLPSPAVDVYTQRNNGSRGYVAMALGFGVCVGVAGLVKGAIKLAELNVDGFGIGVFALACAAMVICVAHMLVQLMKTEMIARDHQPKWATREVNHPAGARTQRSLEEHRDIVPPFGSVTDHTTRIFEPATKKS